MMPCVFDWCCLAGKTLRGKRTARRTLLRRASICFSLLQLVFLCRLWATRVGGWCSTNWLLLSSVRPVLSVFSRYSISLGRT